MKFRQRTKVQYKSSESHRLLLIAKNEFFHRNGTIISKRTGCYPESNLPFSSSLLKVFQVCTTLLSFSATDFSTFLDSATSVHY